MIAYERSIRQKKKVVTLGNGTGHGVLLEGLKRLPYSLTAIVNITDNGGHSGLLRQSMDIPSPGDLRKCITSLADPGLTLTNLLKYRFSEGELEGVCLGNLIIGALIRQEGALSLASAKLGQMLGLEHEVIPASDESTHICAQLPDGTVVVGEWEIIERGPEHKDIQRLFLQKTIRPVPRALEAIGEADFLIIGPGSLRTGIISLLLVAGIKEAIGNSKANKVYICNLMTQPGQTDHFALRRHMEELYRYLPIEMDYTIVNDPGRIPPDILRLVEDSYPVVIDHPIYPTKLVIKDLMKDIDWQDIIHNGWKRKRSSFRSGPHLVVHDPDKLAAALAQIIDSPEIV